MKIKVVFISIILIFALTVSAMADIQFTYEPVDYDTNSKSCPTLFQQDNNLAYDGYHFDFDGKTYGIVDLSVIGAQPFPVLLENVCETQGDTIKAGEYYMVRICGKDNYWTYELDRDIPSHYPIRFYNENKELVYEKRFDEGYPIGIGYFNGTYYCKLYDIKLVYLQGYGRDITKSYRTMISTDMVNWTEIEEESIPKPMEGYTFTHSDIYRNMPEKSMVAIKNSELKEVVYENLPDLKVCYTLGNWVVKWDADSDLRKDFYISSDNVYFEKISSSKNLWDAAIRYMYEYEGELIVEFAWAYDSAGRLRTPIQPVYDAMKKIEDSVYVKLNDKILGFEQPPVVENDRILVPMRFLFEQMGADVEWDEATQTAIATQDNNSVSFGINSLYATVNEETVEMDVSPKLIGDKTYVPLRFLSENLGYTVDWNEELKMATITTESSTN